MPKIDKAAYTSAEATQGGSFKQMEPGAYVVKIVAVRTEWFDNWNKKECTSDAEKMAWFVFDIDEGEFAGEFSRDFYLDGNGYDTAKDWMHQAAYGWYNLGKLKWFNDVLTKSNPGFDPMAALEADAWNLFLGKRFGVLLNGTVTTNDRGYDNWRFKVGEIISVDDVHSGNHGEPKITDKRADTSTSRSGVALNTDGTYDDIPFM